MSETINISTELDPNRPVLPEWTRWAWSSLTERDYWMPLLEQANQSWEELERWSVVDGIRPATYQVASPERFMELSTWAAKYGLVVVPITQINRHNAYRSGSADAFDPSQPWDYRVIITRPESVAKIAAVPDLAKNDAALGDILGYPECCREFFSNTWGSCQVDTTWNQFATTGVAEGPVEANMLWRWKGIRWVSHLPCSYQCKHTVEIGRQIRQMAQRRGYIEVAHTIDTVLSWPTKWSGVNGIAEIVGPCIKVSTRTDWAPPRANRYFERKGRYVKPTKKIWTQNGFKSFGEMRRFHVPIVDAVREFAPENATLIDLGCGNGHLLRRIKLHRSDVNLFGVDVNEDAIKDAQAVGVGTWVVDALENLGWCNELTKSETAVPVYCPVRFAEMSEETRLAGVEALKTCPLHIVYVYSDNLEKMSLEEWVQAMGLPNDKLLVTHTDAAKEVAVGVIRLNR